ncbi:unnamed protein product [Protopolystoma xenopodis]|uniref:Uncharacterized protein n=1 Tax=Protopolystoma xenopodis TaxID=117903 RepID=A0A3S5FDB0_9PLAT|nr:unnamed protein product [Protopolystoma xenopodis]
MYKRRNATQEVAFVPIPLLLLANTHTHSHKLVHTCVQHKQAFELSRTTCLHRLCRFTKTLVLVAALTPPTLIYPTLSSHPHEPSAPSPHPSPPLPSLTIDRISFGAMSAHHKREHLRGEFDHLECDVTRQDDSGLDTPTSAPFLLFAFGQPTSLSLHVHPPSS